MNSTVVQQQSGPRPLLLFPSAVRAHSPLPQILIAMYYSCILVEGVRALFSFSIFSFASRPFLLCPPSHSPLCCLLLPFVDRSMPSSYLQHWRSCLPCPWAPTKSSTSFLPPLSWKGFEATRREYYLFILIVVSLSLLNQVRYSFMLSFFYYFTVRKRREVASWSPPSPTSHELYEESPKNSLKLVIDWIYKFPNHLLAMLLKINGKARHISYYMKYF